MNKKTKWGLVIVISAGLIGWGIYSQLPKENKELAEAEIAAARPSGNAKKVLNVNAVVVKPQALTDEFTTVATLMPDEEVDLSFETSGKITEINFDEGTFVKKGELLAKVNDRQLQAQLKRLLAQLKLAEDRVFRQDALLKRDAVSQEAFEQAKTVKGRPSLVLANTVKGKGSPVMENKASWHHHVPSTEEYQQIMADLKQHEEEA